MARIVADIHETGWAWRDCKPDNFLLQKNGKLRALDFEAACKIDNVNPSTWGTPAYKPADRGKRGINPQAADSHALGACFKQMVARTSLPPKRFATFERIARRRKVPVAFVEMVKRLQDTDPNARLPARVAQQILHDLRLRQ
jgi:serine/threonine protein kinase